MYYTYVLLDKNHNFYIGYTDNLIRRLTKHKAGLVTSTKFKLPLILIYYEAVLNKYDALNREKYLKSGPGHKFLKKRIKYYLSKTSRGSLEVL